MSNEELQQKINEYCGSRVCRECIFNDAVGCLGASSDADSLKRLKAVNRFKKEILGEEKPYKVKDDVLEEATANYHICFSDIEGKYEEQQMLLDAYRVLVKKAEIYLFDSDHPRLEMHYGESEDAVKAFKRIIKLEKEENKMINFNDDDMYKEALNNFEHSTIKHEATINKAIRVYWKLQLVKAAEECSELASALNKYFTKYELTKKQQLQSKHFYMKEEENVKEEIADVEIMLLQVKKILEIKEEDLEEIKKQKLERLEKTLENVYEEN